MAITTNHTIDTTLRKAIDYILNPDKTDAKLLVHAYACTPEIADIEFDCTREHAYNKGEHLARHIIQAFRRVKPHPNRLTKSESVSLMNCWAVNLNTF